MTTRTTQREPTKVQVHTRRRLAPTPSAAPVPPAYRPPIEPGGTGGGGDGGVAAVVLGSGGVG